jgi:hypothetical protein
LERTSTQTRRPLAWREELSILANTGSAAGALAGPALAVLTMRYRPRRKTRTLSTGSRMRPHGSDREGGSSTWHRPLNEGSVVGTAFGERVDHAGCHAGDRGGRLAGDPPP